MFLPSFFGFTQDYNESFRSVVRFWEKKHEGFQIEARSGLLKTLRIACCNLSTNRFLWVVNTEYDEKQKNNNRSKRNVYRVLSSSVILVVGGGSGKHHVGLRVLDERFGNRLFLSADFWIIRRVPITNFHSLLKRLRSSRNPLPSPVGPPCFYRQFNTVLCPSTMLCQ